MTCLKTLCFKPAAAVLVLLLGLLPLSTQAKNDAEPQRVVFKQTEDATGNPVELQLHIFKPEGWTEDDARPAIVFFFGGGWAGGTPTQFYPHCRELADRGMVAIAAEYRVRKTHGTPPQACVEDGKSAIRFVRANADALGVDPERIVAGGGSAGGHVAACTGVVKGFEAEGEDHEVSSVPNLMVLFNPVLDTTPGTGYGSARLGDDPASLSPQQHIHKDQPASIVFHGDADTTVPITVARAFARRSKELGATCVLEEYADAGHGFFNHSSFRKPKAGTPDYYALTVEKMIAFLGEHGYLESGDE